jgi:hypothetical protein
MSDIKFVDGLMAFPPFEKAPDFVKCALSIDRLKMIAWLTAQTGEKIKVDVKVGRSGKWYASVNEWKPKDYAVDPNSTPDAPQDFNDEIPF